MQTNPIPAAVLTSTSLRHQYFHQALAKHFDVRMAIVQEKQNYYQKQRHESEFVRQHFASLEKAEVAEFSPRLEGRIQPPLAVYDINDAELVAETLERGVEMIFLFGTVILKNMWLEAFPNRIINLHLGLSPYYRGSATLFWPFAQNELECVGTTTHLAVAEVDAGPILGRTKPDYEIGDNYYSITNRLIRKSIDLLPDVALKYLSGSLQPLPQTISGRAWRKADFTEESLRQALANIGAGLTEQKIQLIQASSKCPC